MISGDSRQTLGQARQVARIEPCIDCETRFRRRARFLGRKVGSAVYLTTEPVSPLAAAVAAATSGRTGCAGHSRMSRTGRRRGGCRQRLRCGLSRRNIAGRNLLRGNASGWPTVSATTAGCDGTATGTVVPPGMISLDGIATNWPLDNTP